MIGPMCGGLNYVGDDVTRWCLFSGSCVWLFVATFLKLPVSTTHSIVGATVGFALVAHGHKGINWMKMGFIGKFKYLNKLITKKKTPIKMDCGVTRLPDFCVVGSWFISPVLSGLISVLVFLAIKILVLNKEKPLEPGLRLLPMFYALTAAINLFSVFYKGSSREYLESCSILGYLYTCPYRPSTDVSTNQYLCFQCSTSIAFPSMECSS